MKSSGWSSLLLGTILATSAFGTAVAQSNPEATYAAAQRVAAAHSTDDMALDPAVLALSMEAARIGQMATDEVVDRITTGSILPLEAGPRTGGLSEIKPPKAGALREPVAAPEPVRPRPASYSVTTPTGESVPRNDATPSAPEAPAAAPVASEPVAPAVPAPAVPEAKSEPAPAEAVKPATSADVPSAPAPEAEKAAATPSSEPEKAAEAAPAPEKTGEAEKAAASTPTVEPTAAASPAIEPEKPSRTASVPASEPVAPSYSTASEAKPAEPKSTESDAASTTATVTPSAPATPTAAPSAIEPSATATAAPAPVPAAAEPVVASSPAPAAPVVAPAQTTDAAIAATLAAEKAAAALKTALDELQPLAGPAEDRADRAALLAFYADRAFLPLFVDAQGTTDRARAAMGALARAGEDGLEPRDYALPRVEAGLSPEIRAKNEIVFALKVVHYARHLQSGRFDPGRVHDLVTPTPIKTEARQVLDRVATSASVTSALQDYAPPHEGYRRLKAMLAELRSSTPEAPMVLLPVGPTLKPGQKDARVALLRERLGIADVATDAEMFDPALANAVKAFQRERGLSPTGSVGRDTVSALNGEKTGTSARISDMISNMERWRWLPRDLGELHVFVNTADFHLDVMKQGRSIHHARVIVGKPSNPTPIFSEMMQYVVVNPYWNVPYSIVKNEMIGKAQSTAGGALSRGNFEVEIGRKRVDPSTVDWTTVSASQVTIRQRPGDGNALGNIKFLFPNRHSVYLHDTSSRGLFAQSYRALSHGCVRVHEPFSFADAVLSEEPEKVDGARLKKMIGGGEKTINLKHQVPVHIAYFTAWIDDAGQIQNRPDVYGHDGRVKRLLGL